MQFIAIEGILFHSFTPKDVYIRQLESNCLPPLASMLKIQKEKKNHSKSFQ